MLSFKEEAFSAFAIDILTRNDYDISDSVFLLSGFHIKSNTLLPVGYLISYEMAEEWRNTKES